jgi:NAD(P)-dependent dehydrogenase (short-subunit alcohol dehydrogenase family)
MVVEKTSFHFSICEKMNFEGKVALVTGGSRGIGKAIASGLAEFGAHVIITARNLGPLEEAANQINESGGKATAIACHSARSEEISALFDKIQNDFGKLDILVNNSATNPYFGPIIEQLKPYLTKH